MYFFQYHHSMMSFGSSITHVFKCEDIQNYCFFTHLQYVQNTIFIITVSFDCFSRSFVASIQVIYFLQSQLYMFLIIYVFFFSTFRHVVTIQVFHKLLLDFPLVLEIREMEISIFGVALYHLIVSHQMCYMLMVDVYQLFLMILIEWLSM